MSVNHLCTTMTSFSPALLSKGWAIRSLLALVQLAIDDILRTRAARNVCKHESKQESEKASKQVRKKARKQESKKAKEQASKKENKKARKQKSKGASKQAHKQTNKHKQRHLAKRYAGGSYPWPRFWCQLFRCISGSLCAIWGVKWHVGFNQALQRRAEGWLGGEGRDSL